MREQIKLIISIDSLTDHSEAASRMVELQKKGYKLAEHFIDDKVQSYYMEQENSRG